MTKYFYIESGEQKGPVSIEALKGVGITGETLVWYDGLDDWVAAAEVEALKEMLEPIPPAIPSATTSTSSSQTEDTNDRDAASAQHYQERKASQSMFSAPFSFTGRIRRLEFGLSVIIGTVINSFSFIFVEDPEAMGVISILISLATLAFFFAQGAKRCHDFNFSGWGALLMLIPLVTIIYIFIPGTVGPNQYGEDPKGQFNF
jgi:uncharacterized membrane protein YhaH (DUF805 family)